MEVWDKDSFGPFRLTIKAWAIAILGISLKTGDSLRAVEQSAAVVRYHSVGPAELQQVAWGENETFLTLKVAVC